MQQNFRTGDFLKVIIILIVLLSIIFTVVRAHNSKTLPVYQDSNKVETVTNQEEETEELDVAMSTFVEPTLGIQISIPSDWQQASDGNMTLFTHKDSASTFQIEVMDYDPSVNNMNQESASVYVSEGGNTFTAFNKDANNHYELMYQDTETNIHDYIEEVYWDRNNIVKLTCIFSDANYSRISPYYEKIINSMIWNQEDPIPEGIGLVYNENPPFECGIPMTWTVGMADGGLYATDPETGASVSASVSEPRGNISDVTATDAAQLLNNGYESFMMSSFNTDEDSLTATCTYVLNGVQYQNRTFVRSDGTYWYTYKLDYEEGMLQNGNELFETCKSLLRSF